MQRTSEWEPERKFLSKQVRGEGSLLQGTFDWFFGVIVPIGCFYFDPIVFIYGGLYYGYSTFVYILSVVAISGLFAWKIFGKKLKSVAGFLAIFFYISGTASLFLGMALLPFSILGVLIFIGWLGFAPFISAFVYFRNGLRAMRFAGQI